MSCHVCRECASARDVSALIPGRKHDALQSRGLDGTPWRTGCARQGGLAPQPLWKHACNEAAS
eukprot:4657297-Alexandrium_andersonii.AAC.1